MEKTIHHDKLKLTLEEYINLYIKPACKIDILELYRNKEEVKRLFNCK